ncbi:iron-containing redox enzyme family protein [Streptomyces sp. JJ66]|uniref:iron-containing redox enzyme family protein n=1 Tax=Streptomyces sp. JJ66 TaxID=2803843 RepID=UPI001C55F382|nr:iron-containing redox enzyme family protein [Streptomyces sp. JJ66]MBW1600717.1 iron-containing redox enzyme family protein [Streptomyces sp. JJ66]
MTTAPTDPWIPCTAIDQKRLYDLYVSVPTAAEYEEMLEMEGRWIDTIAERHRQRAPRFASHTELLRELSGFLAREGTVASDSHRFLAEEATLNQFRVVVGEFALDGLTESLNLLPVVPRLPYKAGMAVFRVMVDELGCGNDDQAHSELYRELLRELDMPTEVEDYRTGSSPQSHAYVNMFHWLASRAPTPEYFLGGYAYFEASVLYGFRSFAQAARRLGLKSARYYTEHLYIDTYHSKQMRVAIRETQAARGLDLSKVWAGVELTSAIVHDATETAISLAREAGRA